MSAREQQAKEVWICAGTLGMYQDRCNEATGHICQLHQRIAAAIAEAEQRVWEEAAKAVESGIYEPGCTYGQFAHNLAHMLRAQAQKEQA